MVIYNGHPLTGLMADAMANRGLQYADGVFETLRVSHGRICFWEAHYFRLMAAMRFVRLPIPMDFTPQALQNHILQALPQPDAHARVRLTVFRSTGGLYTPTASTVDWVLQISTLEKADYELNGSPLEVDVYKEAYVSAQPLSNYKTLSKTLHVMAGVYARENGWDSCLLLNEHKNLCEAISGNVFAVLGQHVITPPLTEGCLKGIVRAQLLQAISQQEGWTIDERPLALHELNEADELWITNVIEGIRPVTRFRKKTFHHQAASYWMDRLNLLARS